jgi:hypothetical protein
MEENRARRVADALRARGIKAHFAEVGTYQFGVRVTLSDGREAEWDTDGTAGLEAQVMQDGDLVGFIPEIEGSEDFTEEQVIDAIARADYDEPIGHERAEARPWPPRAACSAGSGTASATAEVPAVCDGGAGHALLFPRLD